MVKGQRRVRTNSRASAALYLDMGVRNVKITDFFACESELNLENRARTGTDSRPCVRTSPRKHPSTLSVLQNKLQNDDNTPKKSPHKIEINYDAVADDLASENNALTTPQPSKQRRLQSDKREGVVRPCRDGAAELTHFFPVRRSVRKTKKAVQEEKKQQLEQCVLTQCEHGLRVEQFGSKGRGVITTKHFARGDYVVEYAGQLISVDEAREREAVYANDSNAGCYMYYFVHRNTQMCVDATAESKRLGRLVNHSRQGNLTTKIIEVGSKPHLVLIAKDDIPEGRELTYDYGDRSKESLKYHPWLAF